MSSRAEGHLRPSSGRPDLSRTSPNVSSVSAQPARSAGSARESPRRGGTSTRPAVNPFQIAQPRPSDRRSPGRGTDSRPSEDLTAPAPRNMDRESPTQQQQQQQRQQQLSSAGSAFCARCRSCLACCSCDGHIENPEKCLTAGGLVAGVCCAAGVISIGLHGF